MDMKCEILLHMQISLPGTNECVWILSEKRARMEYRNTQWEKSKNVRFCNILNTLQLFINIAFSPCRNKVICDKFIS